MNNAYACNNGSLSCIYLFLLGIIITGQSMMERPLVVGLVTGILMGDMKTGVLMGASLEAIFLGKC